MKMMIIKVVAVVLMMVLLSGGVARGDVEVSVTLTGDIDEIMTILRQLQRMGIGSAQAAEPSDPLRLEMQSVSVGSLDEPASTNAREVAETESPRRPGLTNVQFEPMPLQAGEEVLVTVDVVDPFFQVDTIGMALEPPEGETLQMDLFDSGQRGDKVAGDGTWSRMFGISSDAPEGEYVFTITAYDANGQPVRVEGDEDDTTPLELKGTVSLTR